VRLLLLQGAAAALSNAARLPGACRLESYADATQIVGRFVEQDHVMRYKTLTQVALSVRCTSQVMQGNLFAQHSDATCPAPHS
jgi:hypothetical protein